MRKGALLLFFALLLIVPLFSQVAEEWYVGKPIRDIIFKGLDTVSANELAGIVAPYQGRRFTDQVFWDLQSSIYALDYFESIIPNAIPGDPERKTVNIEFTVEERPVVGEVRFRGNRKVRTGDLLDAVLIKSGDMINQAKIRIDEEALRILYLERGFPDVSVSSTVEEDAKKKRQIVIFDISEGSQTSIRSIVFSGNLAYSSGTLKKAMESKEQSLFNSGTYQEKVFEQDLRLIERYYQERGYIDARIEKVDHSIERDEAANRSFLLLTIYVYEGVQYKYGGMSFEGNQLFSDEKLASLLKHKPGGIVNLSRTDADFQRVADLYYENGYIFNTIQKLEDRDEAAKTVSYHVLIVERNRAHIENLIIKGNKKTKDFVLYREIPLEVGDVFSKAKIMEAMQNLYNLQYFSAVSPETPPGSADGLMDVIINVEEASTADIMFGLAFGGSADFPISGNIKWTDRNFLGKGQIFSVELNASPVVQSLVFNFMERYLMGQRWSGGFDLTVRHATMSGVPQDILWPIFDGNKPGEDAFPDPFTGEYVYSSSGVPFQGSDTELAAAIAAGTVVTDYEYAGGTTAVVPSQYKMSYESYDLSLGFNTGYRFRTPLGTLGTGTSLRTTLSLLEYDEELYRPYLKSDRENNGTWSLSNSIALSLSLDKRDFYFNPSRGYYLSQTARFVGGPLRGQKHYIKTETKAENFFTLVDVNVTENWRYRLIFGAHSALSFILPQFWTPSGFDRLSAGTADLLWVDGMYIARGWGRELDKRTIWDNWLELRMPLAEQIIWFDLFFDMVGRWDTPEDFHDFHVQDFLFGYGAGLRFTIPQFPIRIYMAKRFQVDKDGRLDFKRGPLFRDSLGMDFVFSIGYEIFNQ